MAVKIRLRRMGAKKNPYYRIVVADSRYPRDGRFIEEIGTYNPLTSPSEVKVDAEKAKQWLGNGAQPTDTVKALLKKEGILYWKNYSSASRRVLLKIPRRLPLPERTAKTKASFTISTSLKTIWAELSVSRAESQKPSAR